MSEDKHIKPYMRHVKYYGTNCCMIGLLRVTQGNVPEWMNGFIIDFWT